MRNAQGNDAVKGKLLVLALTAAVLATGEASAHHSFAMYERQKTFTLSGTVKEYFWASPHVTIDVLAENPKGGIADWRIEGSAPAVLARGGWTASLFQPGDRISLGVHPRKDGAPGGLLADEQQLLINGQPAKGVLWVTPPGKDPCAQ